MIIVISFILMFTLKGDEEKRLAPYYALQKCLKLKHFEHQKSQLKEADQELFELWESMLTGRSAPLSSKVKEQYKKLGLNHLFTPSGFHLSAVLAPFTKLVPHRHWHLILLLALGLGIFSLVGQSALKRMMMIKIGQHFCGQRIGFMIALLGDILFGSFDQSPLSFCYSFLFLGIIYSKTKLIFIWFFFAQCLITFFSGSFISPLLLILSPLLNVAFAFAMPLLLILAIPLWKWQLQIGLGILSLLQNMVLLSVKLTNLFPVWEVNFFFLLCFAFVYLKKKTSLVITILFICNGLNLESLKKTTFGSSEFVPQGREIKRMWKEDKLIVKWSDGQCEKQLTNGLWWEKCSPLRRSSHLRFRKLSSL
jgi:competence protein ComEC